MKKMFLVFMLTILTASQNTNEIIAFHGVNEVESVMSVSTKWIYRVYNGKLQRRLWHEQEGIWLTEWEFV